MVIPKDNSGVLVPICSITIKYNIAVRIIGIIFLLFTKIMIMIGVSSEMIPLISFAELKNPRVPALVISYVLNPIFRQFGTSIASKYVISNTIKVMKDIFISSFILYKAISIVGK